MRLRFCESDINDLANDYRKYQEAAGEGHRETEDQVIGFEKKIQEQGYLFKYHLYRVAYWVLSVYGESTAEPTLENAEELIKVSTRESFRSIDHWGKLMTLTDSLQGIGQTTASAILHLYDKEQYPILSKPALRSIKVRPRDSYPPSLWLEYIKFCRDIANRNGVEMRTLDRALWFYSHDHSS